MGLIARCCLSRLGYDRQVLEYGVGSGPPSDIWSLGVLTYVLLSGTLRCRLPGGAVVMTSAGSFVGEMGIWSHGVEPRTATIEGRTPGVIATMLAGRWAEVTSRIEGYFGLSDENLNPHGLPLTHLQIDEYLELYDGERRREAAASSDDFDDEGNNMHDVVFALPYSHDIVSIHLSRSMGALLYDDELEKEKKELVKTFGARYNFPKKIEHAEVTLPFTGFLEHGRQLISIPRRTKPNAVDGVEPFRDEAEKKENVRLDYVSACLGRRATYHDLREWAAQRAGSSQFYGISGNVFAQSVWRRHAIAALMSRGMIESATETAANVVRYRSSQLFSRLVEYAANKEGTPYFALDLKLQISEPNSYRAAEEHELGKIHDRAAKIARNEPCDDEEGLGEEESEALCRDVGDAWAAPSLLG